MSIKILKENALDQLKGRWLISFFTLLIYLIILQSTSVLSSILSSTKYADSILMIQIFILNTVISIFLTGVMKTGKCKFLLNMTKDYHSARSIDLFSQFKIYPKAFLLSVLIVVFSTLWYIPILVISVICILVYMISQPIEVIFNVEYYFATNQIRTTMIILIGIIALFIIASLVIQLMYSQAFFILADNPNKSTFSCLQESRFIMKGNKFRYIWLHLSFIGWYLLCCTLAVLTSLLLEVNICTIILLIGFLLIEPYIELTKANFYVNAN
ncbi:putative membrane protein [Clostridium bornimense]|uniref:Putative membrane protein n=1 Tax=Clostridium bornimense TaxID=1216932 RepID=W6RZS4_9CLOT|nr:DUF975 family protein [Clostridium bornimense]CDM70161.1 putative membrane protein [Clostridium bornimense]